MDGAEAVAGAGRVRPGDRRPGRLGLIVHRRVAAVRAQAERSTRDRGRGDGDGDRDAGRRVYPRAPRRPHRSDHGAARLVVWRGINPRPTLSLHSAAFLEVGSWNLGVVYIPKTLCGT